MKSRWLPVIGICGRKELLCILKLIRDIQATQRGHPNDFNEFPVVSPEGGSLHGLAQQYWYRCLQSPEDSIDPFASFFSAING